MDQCCQDSFASIFQQLFYFPSAIGSFFSWKDLSWQKKIITQIPQYDIDALKKVLHQLVAMPPLLKESEIINLRQLLRDAKDGKAFILQIGDCAETFKDAGFDTTIQKADFINLLSEKLKNGIQSQVVKIGRLAGQYAKPRTDLYEIKNGTTMFSYRGDLINNVFPTPEARQADVNRMLRAYNCSASILQTLRYQAQLASPHSYANQIYVSHEALHLFYEQALTRYCKVKSWYNSSTHFPWVGIRTAYSDYAHIDYVSGILNPVAIKISSKIVIDDLLKMINMINPENAPDKLALVHRFGVNAIESHLPQLLSTIKEKKLNVIWICDPMHGNTENDGQGFKIRKCDNIHEEISLAYDIHFAHNCHLAGIHLEATHEDVSECLSINETTINADKYKSFVDPRLNREQTIAVIDHVIHCIKKNKGYG